MKRFLVVTMALVMALCSLAMVGCGKKGVSYTEFHEKAHALEVTASELKSGSVNFQFSGDADLGPDFQFEIDENGQITYEEDRVKMYSAMVWEEIPRFLKSTLQSSYLLAWDVEEIEEKDEKTENGTVRKVSVEYQVKNEFSVKINDYMKTAKGNVQDSTAYYKYSTSNGHLVERVKKVGNSEIKMVIVWDEK